MREADVLWKLVAAGVVTQVARAREVLQVSECELRAARARYEVPVQVVGGASTRKGEGLNSGGSQGLPLFHPGRAADEGSPTPPAWSPAKWRPTTAGARRQADKAFRDLREWVQLRVVQVDCAVCGDPIETGDRVVIDSARHASCGRRTVTFTDLEC